MERLIFQHQNQEYSCHSLLCSFNMYVLPSISSKWDREYISDYCQRAIDVIRSTFKCNRLRENQHKILRCISSCYLVIFIILLYHIVYLKLISLLSLQVPFRAQGGYLRWKLVSFLDKLLLTAHKCILYNWIKDTQRWPFGTERSLIHPLQGLVIFSLHHT